MTPIPTINELYLHMLGLYETQGSITLSSFGKSFIRVSSKVMAMQLRLLYTVLGKVERNMFADTCDIPTLIRIGIVKIGRPPYQAVQGKYVVDVTGPAGATIAANTIFKSNDDSRSPGLMYVLDTAYVLTGAGDHITLRALTGGTAARLNTGDELTATQPLGLVDSVVTVSSEDTVPVDAENIDVVYRKIVLASFRSLSGSWSALDYRLVGSNVLGVQQIYAYNKSGVNNEIDVFIEATTDIDPTGAPSPTVIAGVEAAIEAKRPLVVKQIHYLSVVTKAIAIDIVEVATLTAAQKVSIEAALREGIGGVRPFIAAADDVATRQDSLGTDFVLTYCLNLNSVIAQAIPGVAFGAVTFTVGGSVVTHYNFFNGEIPYLSAVTYS